MRILKPSSSPFRCCHGFPGESRTNIFPSSLPFQYCLTRPMMDGNSKPPAPQRTASAASRRSRVQPIEVQSTLTNAGGMAAKSSPAEYVTTPNSPTHSIASSRASFQSHGRAMSTRSTATESTATTRPNRFSMSFPIQPIGTMSPTRTSQSPTREAPSTVPETLASPTGASDTNFLTAIAAQERRVLELKEELQRAEADLIKLKRQWAQHEANKKRNDARRVTKLQPLQTTLPSNDKAPDSGESEGASASMQAEMERRKALINANRSSNRTVFSGSRHTRTLSLLSPAREEHKPAQRQSLPPRKDSLSTNTARRSAEVENNESQTSSRPPLIARASTTPDLTTEVADVVSPQVDLPDNFEASAERDDFLRTGKKFASEFRDGLWTFFEDLRQATVGDEAAAGAGQVVHPPNVRRQSSQTSGLSAKTARKQTSRTSLRPSSPGSTTTGSRTSAETRRPSPNQSRPKHFKSATHGALPDLSDPSFWTDQGPHTMQATPAPAMKKSPSVRGHRKNVSKVSSTESEAWDTWDDSPKDSRSSSAASETHTLPSSVSGATSPRPSADSPNAARTPGGGSKDPLPWPALNKFGPATLRRSASHLMKEWEKSLTPSPGKEFTGQEDYMGFGAEAAAMERGGKKD